MAVLRWLLKAEWGRSVAVADFFDEDGFEESGA